MNCPILFKTVQRIMAYHLMPFLVTQSYMSPTWLAFPSMPIPTSGDLELLISSTDLLSYTCLPATSRDGHSSTTVHLITSSNVALSNTPCASSKSLSNLVILLNIMLLLSTLSSIFLYLL